MTWPVLLGLLLFLCNAKAGGAQLVGSVQVQGQVSSTQLPENSGLAASRLHPGIVYGHNDHGDSNRIFALDPLTGDLKAILTIEGAVNRDWEDLCLGSCGQGENGSCIYIGDIGSGNKHHPRRIYKVREPEDLKNGSLTVIDTYTFTWSEDDAESLVIDPVGDLYIISKDSHGDALFAKLPPAGWGSSQVFTIGLQDSVPMNLHTTHHDPQGADLSPDGRALLVKTEEGVLLYTFSSAMDYLGELGHLRPLQVSTYVRRPLGEAVAWNTEGTGFWTLPEGVNPVFNYYTVSRTPEDMVG